MENNITPISEIFKGIFERFRSPFFFSYLISFLAINWQTLILIFIYDPMHFRLEYSISLMDYISTKLNLLNSLLYPIVLALFYTFLYPIFNIWISDIKAYSINKSTTRALEIRKEGKLSIDHFIKIRQILIEKEKSIEELQLYLTGQLERDKDFSKKESKFTEDINRLELEIKQLRDLYNYDRIDGYWDLLYISDGNSYQAIDVDISRGLLSIKENTDTYNIGRITFFFLDEKFKKGSIIIELSTNNLVSNNSLIKEIFNGIVYENNNLINIAIVNVEINNGLYYITGIINNRVLSMKQKAKRNHSGNIKV